MLGHSVSLSRGTSLVSHGIDAVLETNADMILQHINHLLRLGCRVMLSDLFRTRLHENSISRQPLDMYAIIDCMKAESIV
jgi:hypothetical protein